MLDSGAVTGTLKTWQCRGAAGRLMALEIYTKAGSAMDCRVGSGSRLHRMGTCTMGYGGRGLSFLGVFILCPSKISKWSRIWVIRLRCGPCMWVSGTGLGIRMGRVCLFMSLGGWVIEGVAILRGAIRLRNRGFLIMATKKIQNRKKTPIKPTFPSSKPNKTCGTLAFSTTTTSTGRAPLNTPMEVSTPASST